MLSAGSIAISPTQSHHCNGSTASDALNFDDIVRNVRRSDLVFDASVRWHNRTMSFIKMFRNPSVYFHCLQSPDLFRYASLFDRLNRLVVLNFIDHTRISDRDTDLLCEFLDYYWNPREFCEAHDIDYIKYKPPVSKSMQSVIDAMRLAAMENKAHEYAHRLFVELKTRIDQGWYVIMNTLTVRDAYYRDLFRTGNYYARDYVRSIDRAVGRRLYGSVRAADAAKAAGDEYHSYFGVVEAGGKTGRLHMHYIHCVKELPPGLSDPNLNNPVGTKEELSAMKAFWPYGFSTPKPIRMSPTDAYGKLGWMWPNVRSKSGVLVSRPVSSFEAAALYVCGYVRKGITLNPIQRKEYPWRTKLNRNFGKQMLTELANYNLKLAITGEITSHTKLILPKGYPLPPRHLLRHTALRLLMSMNSTSLNPQLLKLPNSSPLECFRRVKPGINFFNRLGVKHSIDEVCQRIEGLKELTRFHLSGELISPKALMSDSWADFCYKYDLRGRLTYRPPPDLYKLLDKYF